jgi:hypothetical protein
MIFYSFIRDFYFAAIYLLALLEKIIFMKTLKDDRSISNSSFINMHRIPAKKTLINLSNIQTLTILTNFI